MKKFFEISISLLLTVALAWSAVFCAFAQDGEDNSAQDENASIAETAQNTVTVSADEIDELSFSTAVQKALDTARENEDENTITCVKIEPGAYELKKALRIYGNTALSLYGVTVNKAAGASGNMLRIGSEDSVNKGVTGYYYKNIAVEGGVFDASLTSSTMIKAAHAENFSMTDVTLQNLTNAHMMEVAGVDGFTLKNCAFRNQIVDRETSDEICYEAVQLDVLKNGHIVKCRSEDIPMKNVLVDKCEFENCPRGIGAHTAIMNNPFKNIVIKNSSFINMTSAAIQAMYWSDLTISGNYIDTAPRAIALYATGTNGKGMFLPSVIAEEGGTEAHAGDEYNKPSDSKTVIESNIIKNCGTVKDPLGNYGAAAISVLGYNLTEVYEKGKKDSAGLPVGNYYLSGITIRNNYVDMKGTACRLENVENAEVCSNVLYCGDNLFRDTTDYNGISARYGTTLTRVNNNYIKNAEEYGIRVGKDCSADEVIGNTIDTVETHGIIVNQAPVGTVCDNIIRNCSSKGIRITEGSAVKNPVERNRIFSTPVGLQLAKETLTFLNCNTFCCPTPAQYTKKAYLRNYGNNFTSSADASAVYTDVSKIEISEGRSFKLSTFTTPINCDTELVYSSSDESVAAVTEGGLITARKSGTAEITVTTSNGKTAAVTVTVSADFGETKTTAGEKFSAVNSVYNDTKGVYVGWNKVDGAVKYRVLRKNGGDWTTVSEVNSLSYIDSKVTSGTEYSYTVRAMTADGSFIGSYDTTGCMIKYIAAPDVKFTPSGSSVKLSWNAVAGADLYKVFYKTAETDWKSLGHSENTAKTFSPITPGKLYSFLVVSLDSELNALNCSIAARDYKYLYKPVLETAVKDKKIKLTWSKVRGAKNYVLMVLKLNEENAKWKILATTAKTALTRNGGYGKTYKFKVKCIDDTSKFSSAYSDVSKVKIKKPVVKAKKKAKKKI